jgi:hypothetical protein
VIGTIHARASGDRAIRRRLPKPFALNDQDSVLLHITQLAAFLLIPVIGTIVLFVKFLSGSYCRQTGGPSVSGCGTGGYERVGIDHFAYVPLSEVLPSRRYIYEGGADYWPFWEPLIFAAMGLIAVLALAVFVRALLFPGTSGRPPAARAQ